MSEQLLGFNTSGKMVRMSPEKRVYHHHIIGSSGSGKSKFLEALMRNDLLSGQGFCLLDPHGTLYHDILKFCAYRHLNREIILLNLSEPEQIIGFNFFSRRSSGDVAVQVDSRLLATLHAWGVENADQTPTLERVLRLIYTSLLEADLTLPQISVMLDFKEKKIRDEIISKIENDLIRREWQELSDLTKAGEFRDEILSAKNRLFRLLTSKALMRFLGVKGQTVDLLDAMNRQKIILVNLARSEHLSPENARLFGALLINQFFEAATQRKKDALGRDPQPFHIYADEFQNFVSLDLCDMLDEVRKFGLFLTLSHQRFGQLSEEIEDAILTNCRIKTVFGGLRTDDARRMAEELFIGKLDPLKIKVAIYQTKHLYQYTREKVYSTTRSYSESDGYGSGQGSGRASGTTQTSGGGQVMLPPSDEFFTGGMWFDDNITSLSESSSESFVNVENNSSFASESHSSGWSESESVTDVPVFVPVPIQELSSIQYYTTDEQLLELTQALKLNLQRHCFIQLPNQETQPFLTPFVEDFYVSKDALQNYIAKKTGEMGAISPMEADRLIFQSQQDLLQLEDSLEISNLEQTAEEPPVELKLPPPMKPNEKKKKNIFDKIKKDNPNLDI